MIITQPRKNRISLEDYNYMWDIQQRLFLSSLTVFETEVLHEIIDGSLTTTLDQLADTLDADEAAIGPILEKLMKIHLVQVQDNMVFVDKELRKYFETHMAKFEEDFKPCLEFLQALLHNVPIHVLPAWYSIPKNSDHIFQSIIDKYMITPKTYSSYLKQLTFENEILNEIFHDLYASPDFCLKTKDVKEKYHLDEMAFAECALYLEYYLVGFVGYEKNGEAWEEVITPFAEWLEYLRFQKESCPKSVTEPVKLYHPEEFGFAKDMGLILAVLEKRSLPVEEDKQDYILLEAEAIFPHYSQLLSPKQHIKNLIAKLLQLKLARLENGVLYSYHKSPEWQEKSLEEQAMIMYRHPGSCFRQIHRNAINYTDRDLREIEKNLRRILQSGWVYFDEFMKGVTAQIGELEEVTLKHKGKKWCYQRPKYTEAEEQIIRGTICGRLFESGMIELGMQKEKLCIRVTPFGAETFGEY